MSSEQKTDKCLITQATLDDAPACPDRVELAEGTHIHRYLVLGLIGQGGMGAVYKAYDPELDRRIAIKILAFSPQEGETASIYQSRLMREAQALARLSHPNVIAVYDVGIFQDGVYIAMEYTQGSTLRDWLAEHQPTHTEILDVFQKAGAGLLAAHDQGLVHRDFKPENVLVGEDGQVKVLDFGLARARGFENLEPVGQQEISPSDSSSSEHLLSTPLTQAGAWVGTPAYMAPEHFHARPLDERTDQFSYCVSLAEALYGRRPFAGRTMAELADNILQGRLEIPSQSEVPSWIQAIIQRGLSVSKNERYQSMRDLLNDLGHDPQKEQLAKRKRMIWIGLFFIVAMSPFVLWYSLASTQQLCKGANEKLTAIWNPTTQAEVSGAFRSTGLSYAHDSLDRVERMLDSYLTKWEAEYIQSCEATHVKGEQSHEILDLRMNCLHYRLKEFSALTSVFAGADKTVVEKSVHAVSRLSDIADCRDLELLKSKVPTPGNKKVRQTVRTLRERLIMVKALRDSGKFNKALALNEKIVLESREIGYLPLIAEALLRLGTLQERTSAYSHAKETLNEAAFLADKCAHDVVRARARGNLVFLLAYNLGQTQAAQQVLPYAEAANYRLRKNKNIYAQWLHNQAYLPLALGDHDRAQQLLKQALAIKEASLGPAHLEVANFQNSLGYVRMLQGGYEQAQPLFDRALLTFEKALGSHHPLVAYPLLNLGVIFRIKGKYNHSQEHIQKALSIWQNSLGPTHPLVSTALYDLGFTFIHKGDYNQARQPLEESLAIHQKTNTTDNPALAWTLAGLGEVTLLQNRIARARAVLERCIQLCDKSHCDAEPEGMARFALARILINKSADKPRALRLAQQAKDKFAQKQYLTKRLGEVEQWLEKKSQAQPVSVVR